MKNKKIKTFIVDACIIGVSLFILACSALIWLDTIKRSAETTVVVNNNYATTVVEPAKIIEGPTTPVNIWHDINVVKVYPDEYYAYLQRLESIKSREENIKKETPNIYITYKYLESCGLNKAVICGIIGNMICECGNDLQPTIYNKDKIHYGICQWDTSDKPHLRGASLHEQLIFLTSDSKYSIEYIFNTYGYLYKKGFKYQKFLNLTSAKDAAEAFAIVYERPGSTNYTQRVINALEIFEKFTTD